MQLWGLRGAFKPLYDGWFCRVLELAGELVFNSAVIDLQIVPIEGVVGLNRSNKKGKPLLERLPLCDIFVVACPGLVLLP